MRARRHTCCMCHWPSDLQPYAGQHALCREQYTGRALCTLAKFAGLTAPSPPAGMDSILWRKVNCQGRTVFIENWQQWIEKITAIDPALEVYKVEYNTTTGKADEWFNGGRWSLDVPASVSDDCYDVILVDAPQGFKDKMPGGCCWFVQYGRQCVFVR